MGVGNFSGQIILITGAASGFGKLLAERLATESAKLILADRNEIGLIEVANRLRERGADVLAKTCDVTIEQQVKDLIGVGMAQFQRLDIAVNNAGISTPMKALIDIDESEFDLNFAVNAKSVFFGMKYQIPVMISQGGGSILNVASLAGLGAAPKLAAYGAATLAQGSPMKRLGEPEEIVAAMMGIIAPDNCYMNGQAIAVDGGISAF